MTLGAISLTILDELGSAREVLHRSAAAAGVSPADLPALLQHPEVAYNLGVFQGVLALATALGISVDGSLPDVAAEQLAESLDSAEMAAVGALFRHNRAAAEPSNARLRGVYAGLGDLRSRLGLDLTLDVDIQILEDTPTEHVDRT